MWFFLGDNKIISHGVAKETRGEVDEGMEHKIISHEDINSENESNILERLINSIWNR